MTVPRVYIYSGKTTCTQRKLKDAQCGGFARLLRFTFSENPACIKRVTCYFYRCKTSSCVIKAPSIEFVEASLNLPPLLLLLCGSNELANGLLLALCNYCFATSFAFLWELKMITLDQYHFLYKSTSKLLLHKNVLFGRKKRKNNGALSGLGTDRRIVFKI